MENNKFLLLPLVFALLLIKVYAVYYTEFDLFGDEAQYWLWSKNLDFGYYSKPPLLSWLLALYTKLFGNSFESIKLFSSLVYCFSAFGIYFVCRNINLNKSVSLSCSLFFLVMPAVSVSSFIVSTDVVLILFWTMVIGVFIKIQKSYGFINYILLGIVLGLAFLSKYAAIYFFPCFLVYIYFDKSFRQSIKKNFFRWLIFAVIFFLVISPNLIWNIKNGWLTIGHTANNANLANLDINFFRGVFFLLSQIVMIGPLLFIGFFLNYKKFRFDSINIFLLSFSLPIILIVLLESVLVRANANWAALGLISLYILFFRHVFNQNKMIAGLDFILNFIFGFFLFIVISLSLSFNAFNRISGIELFSKEIEEIVGNKVLVVSDRMLYSNIAYELREVGTKIYITHSPGTKITNHFQINSGLDKNTNQNFILIGSPSDIAYLSNSYKINHLKTFNKKFKTDSIKVYEVIF